MFELLPESQPRKERHPGQMAFAVAVHGVLIIGAAVLTQRAIAAPATPERATATFITPPREEPVPTPPRPPTEAAAPVLRGFQVLQPPTTIPIGLPTVDLGVKFDRRDYVGTGQPGGRFDGVPDGLANTAEAITNSIYQSEQVDDPVQILKVVEPKYPGALRIAGVSGSVTLEFVISVQGTIEDGSLRVVRSSDPRFETAAMEAITRSSYRAARYRGMPVRQLVTQTVNFSVAP